MTLPHLPAATCITRRIFVSAPADQWLTPNHQELKRAIIEKIEQLGFMTELFLDPRGRPGLAAAQAWTAAGLEKVLRSCCGAAILGFPRWQVSSRGLASHLPTEYNQYEAAVAHTLGLPLLLLADLGLEYRGVFSSSFGPFIASFDAAAGSQWLNTQPAIAAFNFWNAELGKRRDVFLGYCGSSIGPAHNVSRYLRDIGVTVLDWHTDFAPAGTILERIKQAADKCTGAIFLFTKDDQLIDPGPLTQAIPRDNVVFEAGYFSSAKGKSRVLIVVETGAKIPADLGGDIYASLPDRSNIQPLEQLIRRFIEQL